MTLFIFYIAKFLSETVIDELDATVRSLYHDVVELDSLVRVAYAVQLVDALGDPQDRFEKIKDGTSREIFADLDIIKSKIKFLHVDVYEF